MSAVLGCVNFDKFTNHFSISNTVGYQEITIPSGWSTFTPVFDAISGANFDWMDVTLLDENGGEFDDSTNQSRNQIQIKRLSSAGILEDDVYQYTTRQDKKWCKGTSALTRGQFTIASGEGVVINNSRSSAVKFRVSGAVNVLPAYTCPAQWSVWGNNTPVAVDFKDVVLTDENGNAFDDNTNQSRNQVQVKILSSAGVLTDDVYQYTTRQNKKWCKGTTALTEGEFVLQPGDAFLINNTRSNVVNLKLPSPISE